MKSFVALDITIYHFTSDSQDKQIWLWLKSFLVKKNDVEMLFDKLKNQTFEGFELPESATLSNIFSREFFDSDAYEYSMTEVGYFDETEIKDIVVLPTIVEYIWEVSSDFSLNNLDI